VLRGTNANGPVPGMGRITGSASIETLVRVGIEKENGLSPDSKMVVLHDFTPCVDDELTVKRGQVRISTIHVECYDVYCVFTTNDIRAPVTTNLAFVSFYKISKTNVKLLNK